ncbi:MAG: HEPN domain-containing protein [Candidatus Brockarchaeota archaeon]|nr:HEPN domain-containing protein [Candidatus Brockarchaeota archaeon]
MSTMELLPSDENILLKVYIGQNVRGEPAGILQSEFKEEGEQIVRLIKKGLIALIGWYNLTLYITTMKGSIIAEDLIIKRIAENEKQLQDMLKEIPERVLGFFIRRFISNDLSFLSEGPPYVTQYDEKWENQVLEDGRIWVLWRKLFDSLVSIGLCVKAHSYVSTRGGEIREVRYAISPEVKKYLVSKYSSLTDFTEEDESLLKAFSLLVSNWYFFLPDYDSESSRKKLYDLLKYYLLDESIIAKIIDDMSKLKVTSVYHGLLSESKPFEVYDKDRYFIYLKENIIKPAVNKLLGKSTQYIVKRELPPFFKEAEDKLESARVLLNSEKYASSLGELQTAVELLIKGVLNFSDIEFPKEHDVSDKLPEAYGKLEIRFSDPEKRELRKCLAQITILSRILSRIRNEFKYPVLDISPSEIFDFPLDSMARELIQEFETLYSQIQSMLERLL